MASLDLVGQSVGLVSVCVIDFVRRMFACRELVSRDEIAIAFLRCRLFRDGGITWGRVITLLCFGYRIAVTVIQRGIRGFFSNVVGFIVKFVLTEKIAKWIAEQGGWVCVIYHSSFTSVCCPVA
jgi:hypothetical protein